MIFASLYLLPVVSAAAVGMVAREFPVGGKIDGGTVEQIETLSWSSF